MHNQPMPLTRKVGCSCTCNYPGPGAYSPQSHSTDLKITIKRRIPAKEPQTSPGPGQYNPNQQKKAGILIYQQKYKPKIGMHTGTPGPGAYQLNSQLNKGTKICKGLRPPLQIDPKTPGPGAYHLHPSATTPNYSLAGRIQRTQSERSPGPAQYSIKQNQKKGIKIAKARSISYQNRIPGPGTYSQPAFSTTQTSFPKNPKMVYIDNQVPGPGNYFIPKNKPSILYSIGERHPPPIQPIYQNPGPSDYQLGRPKTVSFSFTKGQRPSIKSCSPGPGTYQNVAFIPKSSRYSIGKSQRNLKEGQVVPGPGQYEPKQTKPKTHCYMGYRPSAPISENSPSPSQYNMMSSTGYSCKFSFGKDQKLRRKDEKVPGPGSYEQRAQEGPKVSFKKAKMDACVCHFMG